MVSGRTKLASIGLELMVVFNLLNSKEQRFNHYGLPFTQDSGNEVFFIRSILEDSKGTTWIGTQNAGLYFLKNGETNPQAFNRQQSKEDRDFYARCCNNRR